MNNDKGGFAMDIKCIALDLDKTTLNRQGKLSKGNREALISAMKKDVHIVIASGRAFSTLPKDVTSLPGIEYAITSNGAAIYHIPTGTCMHSYHLTPASVNDILTVCKSYPVVFEAFIDGTAYGEKHYIENPVFYGTPPNVISYVQQTRNPINHMPDFIRQHANCLDSIDVVTGDIRIKQKIQTELARISNDIYITSSVPRLLEISHKDSGKHSGLKYIQNHLHLKPEQTAAFGDGDNDIDLLLAAGTGIAMENASPSCKTAADAITKHHDEDGVAWGMRHILHII